MRSRLLLITLFAIFAPWADGECPARESPKEEDTWFIQDRLVPNYVFDVVNFRLKFTTEKNGSFEANLRHVRVAVSKRVGIETCVELSGYNPPSFRDPHRVKIFVGSSEREREWNTRIKKARTEFEGRCFHCVLSGKPSDNSAK